MLFIESLALWALSTSAIATGKSGAHGPRDDPSDVDKYLVCDTSMATACAPDIYAIMTMTMPNFGDSVTIGDGKNGTDTQCIRLQSYQDSGIYWWNNQAPVTRTKKEFINAVGQIWSVCCQTTKVGDGNGKGITGEYWFDGGYTGTSLDTDGVIIAYANPADGATTSPHSYGAFAGTNGPHGACF